MKIGVTSQNFRTVTNHAGKARRIIIFDAQKGQEPTEIQRLKLPKEQALHNCRVGEPHPIDVLEVIISSSFGMGFVNKMAGRGIIASISNCDNPVDAVKQFLEEGARQPECQGEHNHEHEHVHEDGSGCSCGSSKAKADS